MPNENEDWIDSPPQSIEEMVLLLENNAPFLKEKSKKGDTLRGIFKELKKHYEELLQKVRLQVPIAFFKPSYEQALLLNAWIWGINFPICFSANRIGKTVAFVINALLWIFPNNPQWRMFKPYIDKLGRLVCVLPRPALASILPLQDFLLNNPHLVGNFYKQPYEQPNLPLYQAIKTQFATLQLQPTYPIPPIQRGGMLWLGAPDNDFHRHIIMRICKDWLPQASILKWNTTDCNFAISTTSTTNPKTTAFEVDCKSYESQDTKWSGDAVTGIVLTEGFDQSILDELKQRIVNDGFMSWDYTPAEPRNTGKKVALAFKVYKRIEELPLRSFTFIKFSVRDAPDHIIPKEKKADLIRMWQGKEQGKARLDGDFYASSGLVLDKLDRDFHCLDWNLQTLQAKYPDGRFYRGIDPGLDHPAACCWGYLSYNNIWFIIRFYSKRGTTISERCKDIIKLSNNKRERHVTGSGQIIWREVHHQPNSEAYIATVADYHVFKEDEETGLPYTDKYVREGLVLTESTHMGPEERAQYANGLLDRQAYPYMAHPRSELPPSARIFFLINEPGVASALDKMAELFWDRFKAGDNRGEPKDKIPIHGDDELDALCNLVCGPYVWTQATPRRREPSENLKEEQLLPTSPMRMKPEPIPETAGFH